MTISTDRMEQSLRFMAETYAQFGILKALVDDLEFRMKMAEAKAVRDNKGQGTEGHIKALAKCDPEYIKLVDERYAVSMEYQIMSAKRHAEELIFEAWRSINANARKGNIV